MLTPDERAALVIYCNDHAVAVCPTCGVPLRAHQIASDILLGTRDFCPRCRADLTAVLRKHLSECTWSLMHARQTRERAQVIRQQARETSKESQQLRDAADVLAREAEAAQRRARDVKRGTAGSSDTIDAVLRVLRAHRTQKYCAPCLAKATGIADANVVRRVRERAKDFLDLILLSADACDTCHTVRWTLSTP